MGLLLIQMAKALGAKVIGTVSTREKAKLARSVGADDVILYTEEDFQLAVERIAGRNGVDVVYDSVGASTFDKSVACLKLRGYMVLYGQASGPVPPVPVSVLNSKSLFLTRPGLADYTRSREELLQRAGDVLESVRAGKLKVHIHRRFSLSDAAEAHVQLESRATTGKLLLIP